METCNINVKGQDRSELLTGQPIVIELNTYQSGFGSDMDLIDFSGTTLNSNPFTIDKSKCTAGTSGNAYTYTCQASSNIKGDLVVKATITKSGVSNTCSFSKRIDEPTISVEWKDTSFICALPGEHKFYFISKDPFGNYIDTENTLMVYEAGSATPVNRSNLITRTDTGKYEFDYLLSSPLGGAGSAISYKFDVTGYSPDYRKSSSPISGTLEVRTDCSPTECIANSDCQSKYGSNYLCYNGTCKEGTRPNILLYLIIVIAIVVVVLVIFLIIYYSKNKKVDPLGVI